MAHLLGTLAACAAGHWKRSLAIVAVVLVALGLAAAAAGGSFVDDFRTPGTESQRAIDVLDATASRPPSGDTANVVFAVDGGTLREPRAAAAIERTVEAIRAQPHVTGAAGPVRPTDSGQLSADGRIAYVPVQYDDTASALGKAPGERLERGRPRSASAPALEVSRNGAVVDQAEQSTAPVGELIGVAVAMHRAHARVPLGRGDGAHADLLARSRSPAGCCCCSSAARSPTSPASRRRSASCSGSAPGIDYALLIVGRYREQLASGDSVPHAARVANATAGTSVVAAGAIVVVAIAGLLATGIPFVGPDGHRLGDHHRHGRGRRGHRAADADGRLRPAAAAARPEHVAPSRALRALGGR